MKIVHVLAGIGEANGMALTAVKIAREEAAMGHEVSIVTTFDDGKLTSALEDVAVKVYPAFAKKIGFSFSFARGVLNECAGANIVHVHSAWTFPVWWGARCAKRSGARLVATPNGTYDPVRRAHHGGRKRLVGWLDRWVLRSADTVHAISEEERGWVLGFEPRAKRFAIAPLGVDVEESSATDEEPQGDSVRTVLYLGRIHPLKGIDLLVEAWIKVCSGSSKWRLVIAGPDEQGTKAMVSAIAHDAKNIEFLGPVYGEDKQRLLASCDVFVLPSKSESFGLVVAEALACGKPVVCTDAMPWQGVREHGCGWVASVSSASIANALKEAMGKSRDALAAMGAKGKEWMKRDFSWRACAEKILRLSSPV